MSYVQFTVPGGRRLALSAEDIVRVSELLTSRQCEVQSRNGSSYTVEHTYDQIMSILDSIPEPREPVVDRPVRRING